jgi:SAM-dependent methyltransferase
MDPFSPSALSRNLEEREPGFWVSRRHDRVSYPSEGHDLFYELEQRSFWFRHRNNCLLAVLKRYPPPGPLLDVGGGNGFVASALKDAGYGTALVEPGEVGARHAWERGIRPVICAGLEDVAFPPGSLPAVGLFDVLEHIQDDAAFLADLRKLLAPEGRLYMTVPADPSLWSVEDEQAAHYRRYTRATLGRVLERAGFRVEFMTHLFSYLWLPVFLWRVFVPRMGLGNRDFLERERQDHATPSGMTGRVLGWLENRERRRLSFSDIRYGTSLMIVAVPGGPRIE